MSGHPYQSSPHTSPFSSATATAAALAEARAKARASNLSSLFVLGKHNQQQQQQPPPSPPLASTPALKLRGDRSGSRSISPPLLLRGKGNGKAKKKAEGREEGSALDSGLGWRLMGESTPEKDGDEGEGEFESPELPTSERRGTLSFEKEAVFLHSGSASPHSHVTSGPTFLDPTVKKTWAYGYDRDDGEDITMAEVLQPDDLRFAVISSFQWDLDWLYSKINIDSTKVIVIVGAKEESLKRQWEYEDSQTPQLRVCFAPMDVPVQIMHAKLMLLFHPTYLRIVVTTANMMPHDWGETGVMENTVFLIDLPRMPPGDANPAEKPQERQMTTSFGVNLVKFLDAMGLDKRVVQGLINFDFSRTKDIAFVHSIGGVHVGQDEPWRRTGFCGLGLAIQELGLESKNGSPVSVDYVTSSLGATRPDFLQTLYMACQGDDGLTAYCWQHNVTKSGEKSNREMDLEAERLTYHNIYANLRIYYPLRQTVENSRGGTASGGTICFNGDFKAYSYQVQALMRDCQSRRSGLLMHNKLIYVRRLGHLSEPSPGWLYIGSANCSQTAWGKITKDRQLGLPRLTCRNWECGVVIPMKKALSVPKGIDGYIDRNSDIRGMSMSDGIIPVPMHILGMRYRGQNPWTQRQI